MTLLADRAVGLIGTGATGVQCLSPLARSSRDVYVFQRTPSTVAVRANRRTDPEPGRPGSLLDGSGNGFATSPDHQR